MTALSVLGATVWAVLPVVPDGRVQVQAAALIGVLVILGLPLRLPSWSAWITGAAVGWILVLLLVVAVRAGAICRVAVGPVGAAEYDGLYGELVVVRYTCPNPTGHDEPVDRDPGDVYQVRWGWLLGDSVPYRY